MVHKPIVVGRGTARNGQRVVILRVGGDDILLDVDRAEDVAVALRDAALDVRRTSGIPTSSSSN